MKIIQNFVKIIQNCTNQLDDYINFFKKFVKNYYDEREMMN